MHQTDSTTPSRREATLQMFGELFRRKGAILELLRGTSHQHAVSIDAGSMKMESHYVRVSKGKRDLAGAVWRFGLLGTDTEYEARTTLETIPLVVEMVKADDKGTLSLVWDGEPSADFCGAIRLSVHGRNPEQLIDRSRARVSAFYQEGGTVAQVVFNGK